MQPGAVHLDCSTVDVDSARAVAGAARSAGLRAVDAPVSGGIEGARRGTLAMMVGGDAGVLDRVMPDAEVLLLPDTGHLPMLENPRTVAEAWISYTEARARDQRDS